MTTAIILPLDSEVSLYAAGGKGLNLSRLFRAGFPVPPGFIVSTAAYDAFVQINGLAATILDRVKSLSPDDLPALEAASQAIRAAFRTAPLPADIAAALQQAYADFGNGKLCSNSPKQWATPIAVAVRSSATAEDLPGLSFAGQQDTYLNVVGAAALQQAVVDCWSSLWTGRAIGYRTRNGVDHAAVALAVVVQAMAPSETSGVLFTANPLTGRRDETVIDATFGLGEALVSGQVEPDHYVVAPDGRILNKTLGAKAVAIFGRDGGGTVTVEQAAAARQALSDEAISELVRLGHRAADLFGAPQDIEWAGVDGQFVLLQSRPITTLYPLPINIPVEPLRLAFSFASVQGMLDPMTPFGRDAITAALIGVGNVFGSPLTLEAQTVLWEAGERLWIDFTGLVRNRIGRRILLLVFPSIDPSAGQALKRLVDQDRFPAPGPLRVGTVGDILPVLLPMIGRMVCTFLRPDAERERLFRRLEKMLADLETRFAQTTSLAGRLDVIYRTANQAFEFVLPQFVPRFGVGMGTFNLLNHLVATLPEGNIDALAMMRGVPHNVTTEMDFVLWDTARAIRGDPASLAHFQASEAAALAEQYLQGRLPPIAQEAIARFMQRYGMRGLAEIDLGRPRWREEPLPVIQTLRSYLDIVDADQAPDVVYERGRQAAEAEIDRLAAALRRMRGGRIKARVARAAAYRMRALIGLREAPKFTVIRIFGIFRRALLADGAQLVAEGVLSQPDDLFFLHLRELHALAAGDRRDWTTLVRARRQAWTQEKGRRQIPRLLMSDGEAIYEGISAPETASGAVIRGEPVSPGSVEGIVHVVLDPRTVPLAPGEILVCPGTDPSWTPLFLTAGGLVMEVGGLMTHGAVVAREYGLPAVVGVYQATQRLHTGQRVRVDGSSGQIVPVE